MDTYRKRYLELISRWKEYARLEEQSRKDRRIILLCACVVCLLIGFLGGMFLFSPEGHVVVSMELSADDPEAKKEQISL